MHSTAILLAGGQGRRMGDLIEDKILAPLNGKPAIVYSLQAFAASDCVQDYVIVYRDSSQWIAIQEILRVHKLEQLSVKGVQGGDERQFSVSNALGAVDPACTHVFIHDCARPCIKAEAIERLQSSVIEDDAACLAHPVKDTIKRTPAKDQRKQVDLEDLDRSRLWAMETPQVFNYERIQLAYQKVVSEKLVITDDVAAAHAIGLKTTLVENSVPNPKLTTPSDLAYIEFLLANQSELT